MAPMNFVLFFPDELRAESIGCYGLNLNHTPNMDRLAAEGVRFSQCHVQHTVCSPSRCSMTTGWYPHVHGHRSLWNLLDNGESNLFSYLHDAGYEVLWAGKNDLLDEQRLKSDVDDYQLMRFSKRAVKPEGGMRISEDKNDPHYYSFLNNPYTSGIESLGDFAHVDGAMEYLKQRGNSGKPFILFLPLTFPHCPYTCPEEYYDRIKTKKMPPLRGRGANKPDFHQLIRDYRNLEKVTTEGMRKIQSVYLGMTAVADTLLGMVLDTLEDTGLVENTALFFSSDHGDYAGDYHLVEKWPSGLEDVLTRVPLIVRVPGGARGHVVAEQNELFDIMPTILELAGVECRHTHFAQSLVAQLHGADGDPQRRVFAEGGYDEYERMACFEGESGDILDQIGDSGIYWPKARQQQEQPQSVCRTVMIRTLNSKLIYRAKGKSELYDLANDPKELVNQIDNPAYVSLYTQLKSELLDWYLTTADVVTRNKDCRNYPET